MAKKTQGRFGQGKSTVLRFRVENEFAELVTNSAKRENKAVGVYVRELLREAVKARKGKG